MARCVLDHAVKYVPLTSSLSGFDHRFNTWVPREELIEKGFTKLVQQFDDLESSREGAGTRDTAAHLVRKHLEDIGLDGDIAQYNEIAGLSGGMTRFSFESNPISAGVLLQVKRSSSLLRRVSGTIPRQVSICALPTVISHAAAADLCAG